MKVKKQLQQKIVQNIKVSTTRAKKKGVEVAKGAYLYNNNRAIHQTHWQA